MDVRLARRLGADDVGRRVMVRRALPDGGYGDVLGDLLSWAGGRLVIRTRDGALVSVEEASVVAGKPIPPPPRRRTSPERLQEIAGCGWRPVAEEWLGRWWLRAAGGFTGRANSVIPLGDPGVPLDSALVLVRAWYAARGLPALAMVVVGSAADRELAARGWAVWGFSHREVLMATAEVAPVLQRLGAAPVVDVRVTSEPDDAWLALYRAGTLPPVARRVIEHPEARFARVVVDGRLAAIGRAVVVGGWVGLSAVEVASPYRRRGLARAVTARLLTDAADRGAREVYVQVAADNAAAVALWTGVGFATHHSYVYRADPEGS